MKNLERFKDQSLQKAATAYLDAKGLPHIHPWSQKDWTEFANWLFAEETLAYQLDYTVPGNPYLQSFTVNASSDQQAIEALGKAIPAASVENIQSTKRI